MSAILIIVPPEQDSDWLTNVAHQALVRLRRAGHVVGILRPEPDNSPGPAMRSAVRAVDGLVVAAEDPSAARRVLVALQALPADSLAGAVALAVLGSGRRCEEPARELQVTLASLGTAHVLPSVKIGARFVSAERSRLLLGLTALGDMTTAGERAADVAVDES